MTLTPPEVLDQLHVRGVTARITAEGRLRISPVSRLPAEIVNAVKADPSGIADEIRRGWAPEGEGRTGVPPDHINAGWPDDGSWERVLSKHSEETVDDKRRLLVFRQVASLPTARKLASHDDTYAGLYRAEIERWREDERRLRAEGFRGCIGAIGYRCPPAAPVRCQTCERSNR
jgi:hypothetical protein